MSSDNERNAPEEGAWQSHEDDQGEAGGPIDETPEGYPICQWCGSAITEKEDLVVASDETGAPTRIAPVGYTAPRTFASYHRDCHIESSGELAPEQVADAQGFWTSTNVAVIGVALVVVLVVLFFALFPQ